MSAEHNGEPDDRVSWVCPTCHGSGRSRPIIGWVVYVCPACDGRGIVYSQCDWIVVQINNSSTDTHAAHTLDEAVDLANPDQGDLVTVWDNVVGKDAGAARLNYATGQKRDSFRWKGQP